VGNWKDFQIDLDGSGGYDGAENLDQDRTHDVANQITGISEDEGQTAWATPACDAADRPVHGPSPRRGIDQGLWPWAAGRRIPPFRSSARFSGPCRRRSSGPPRGAQRGEAHRKPAEAGRGRLVARTLSRATGPGLHLRATLRPRPVNGPPEAARRKMARPPPPCAVTSLHLSGRGSRRCGHQDGHGVVPDAQTDAGASPRAVMRN